MVSDIFILQASFMTKFTTSDFMATCNSVFFFVFSQITNPLGNTDEREHTESFVVDFWQKSDTLR